MRTLCAFLLGMFLVGVAPAIHADPASQPIQADPASQPAAFAATGQEPAAATKQEPPKKPSILWGYKGGFFAKTDDDRFKLKLGGWAHVTYKANYKDGDLDSHAIDLRMARLVVMATAFKYLHVKTVFEFMDELPVLFYHATFQPYDAFGVRFGQFKAPIVRHFLVAPFKRTFVSSALAMTKFKHDWDMGVNVLGSFRNHMFEYQAGVFNGSGRNKPNDNTDLMAAARFQFNPLGPVALIESDYKNSQKPLLAVGVGAIYNPLTSSTTDAVTGATITADSKQAKMSTDVVFFYKGLAAIAEVYYRSTWTDDKDAVNSIGWLAQAAYFLLPKRLEAGLRGGMIRLDMDKDDADQYEMSTVVNYYVYKTQFKVQGEYSMRLIKSPDKDDLYDHAVRIQGMFKF